MNDRLFADITAERLQLIDRLGTLTPTQWDTPSLCSGWRVRDVVGHLVSILEIPKWTFIRKVAMGGGFEKVADRIAREFGARDPKALCATYRKLAGERFAPPIIGPIAPLTDLLVHARDIERPLGLVSQLNETNVRTVLDFVCGGKGRGFVPPKHTRGLRFQATDFDWSIGTGPVVIGAGEAIMMAVNRRSAALADLSGDGITQLIMQLG